jgi:hypothetical protein
MSRKIDLEQHIRESYSLIRQYEDRLRLSADPKEQARARRAIEEQWDLVRSYLGEYNALTSRLGVDIEEDIAQIATHFGDITPESSVLTLRRVLTDTFSEQELRLLCFDLGIDFEDLRGTTLEAKMVSLVDYLQRRSRLEELIVYVRRERPGAL